MKHLLLCALSLFSFFARAQDKYNYILFNKLTEVAGTEFVIAMVDNWGKLSTVGGSEYLVFVNTKTGEEQKVDFSNDADIDKMEQVKIDSTGINVIVVSARTVDLDGKGNIDWNDPTQLFILSTDGKQKTQVTDDDFFTRFWTINKSTGTIVATGHYDTNDNGKYDKTDKSAILVYDLKTGKLINKV